MEVTRANAPAVGTAPAGIPRAPQLFPATSPPVTAQTVPLAALLCVGAQGTRVLRVGHVVGWLPCSPPILPVKLHRNCHFNSSHIFLGITSRV